jgi:hypothetical protein
LLNELHGVLIFEAGYSCYKNNIFRGKAPTKVVMGFYLLFPREKFILPLLLMPPNSMDNGRISGE